MGIFSFKRGGDKKKKGKAKEEEVEVEKDMFNQAFLGDDPYLSGKGSSTQIYAGDDFLPERAATPTSRSRQNSPPGAHAKLTKKPSGSTLNTPSRPWTSCNGAPRQRTGSFSSMSGREGRGSGGDPFGAKRFPLDNDDRPSTSHGPSSKSWAHGHTFSAQFGPAAGKRPQTPRGTATASPSNAPGPSSDVRLGSNSPTRSGMHNSQSLSDNNMSTSSSAPTETSESSGQGSSTDDQRATSPPSTVSNRSPPSMSPEPVWPLQSSKKSSTDGKIGGGLLSPSSSFGDEAQMAINEAASRTAQPPPEVLVPAPLNPRSRDATPTGPGSHDARGRKARVTANQRDLAIEVPKQHSWGTQIDQLEKSWLEDQQSPGGRGQPRPNGQHLQSPAYYQQQHQGYDQRQNHPQQHPPQRPPRNDRPFDPNHDPRYDPRHDPRYDPRYDPRHDNRHDPRYDPRYRNDTNQDPRRQQQHYEQPYSPGYGPRSQSSHGHHPNGADPRDRHYGNVGGGSYAMARSDRLPSPGMPKQSARPTSAGRDGPRRIGSDFDLSQARIPYGNPPQRLRTAKSMQQLPRSPRDHHNMRGPASPQGQPQYQPRGSSMSPAQYRSPSPSVRSPTGNVRSPQYATPRSGSGGDGGPRYASNAPSPRTRTPQPLPADSGTSYRDPSQYGPLRSPLGSPPHLPNGYPDHAGAYPADRSGQYPVVENPIVYQPLDQPVAGGYQSFGAPLSSERRNQPPMASAMRFPNSPPPEGPSPADRQLPDVAEVAEEKPTGTEVKDFAIKEEPETTKSPIATSPTKAASPKKTAPPRPPRSPPPTKLELPESESTGSLDELTLNSFSLPSRNASPIPQSIPQSLVTALPLTPISPTDSKQDAGLAVLNKAKDILAAAALSKEATTAEVASPTKLSPVVEKAAIHSQPSPEIDDTPPDTPTEETSVVESSYADEKESNTVSTSVVAEKEGSSRPQTPDSMKPDPVDGLDDGQDDGQVDDHDNQEDNDEVVETEVERSSFDSEPPLSPLSLPSSDAEPSPTANWPLPAVFVFPPVVASEKAPENIVEKVIEALAAPAPAPATPVTPTAPKPTIVLDDDEDVKRDEADEDELFPDLKASPTKSKSAFTASVYARDIGLGPYAFDVADNLENLPTEALDLKVPTGAPWSLPERLDSLEKAPQQKLIAKPESEPVAPIASPEVPPEVPPKDAPEALEGEIDTAPETRTVDALPETPPAVEDKNDDDLAAQVASPESAYSWGGGDDTGRGLADDSDDDGASDGHHHLDEEDDDGLGPLSPDSIGLARGPSIIETDNDPLSSPKGKKRWNIASHLNHVDSDVLHEHIIGEGGGVGNGGSTIKGDGPPKMALGSLSFDRHTPTGMVDSFGTTFI